MLLSLVSVVVLGGITASWAFWADSSTVTGGTLTSGSMDMQLSANGTTWGAINLGTAFDDSAVITASNLTPSESYAFTLSLRNVGQADFTFAATVSQGSTWTFVSTPITVRFFAGGTPSTDTTYPIQKTCSGGTALGSVTTVGASATSVFTAARRLNAGSTDSLCLEVAMATSADNTNQGQSGRLRFDFTATQVTS
jgi:predicted ribosomally synthesized peptide with SipW-like signal peptide